MIKKIAYFFHLIDEDDRLNLEDIAFCVILVKVATAKHPDWSALVTLAVCCLNMMHRRNIDAKLDTSSLQETIQEQSESFKQFTTKISPIVDAVKGQLK